MWLLPLLLLEVATVCIALGESLLVQLLVVCSIPGGSLHRLSAEGAARVVTEAATGAVGQQLRNLLLEETGLLLHAVQASVCGGFERLRRRRRRACGRGGVEDAGRDGRAAVDAVVARALCTPAELESGVRAPARGRGGRGTPTCGRKACGGREIVRRCQ